MYTYQEYIAMVHFNTNISNLRLQFYYIDLLHLLNWLGNCSICQKTIAQIESGLNNYRFKLLWAGVKCTMMAKIDLNLTDSFK